MSENTIYLTDFQYRSNKTIIIRNQKERLQFGYSFLFSPKSPITSNEENAVFLHGKRRFLIRKPSFSFAYTLSPRNPRGTNRLSFHLSQCKFNSLLFIRGKIKTSNDMMIIIYSTLFFNRGG